MRKYAIPKLLYLVAVVMLVSLSFGVTYAYFSATVTVTGTAKMNQLVCYWIDSPTFTQVSGIVSDTSEIQLVNTLQIGEHTRIKVQVDSTTQREISLGIGRQGNDVEAYCRIKLVALYSVDDWVTSKDCSSSISLTNSYVDSSSGEDVTKYNDINGHGWTRDGNYYYYGTKASPTPFATNAIKLDVAEYIHLASNATPELYGASVKITLSLDIVQSAHDAHTFVWKD